MISSDLATRSIGPMTEISIPSRGSSSVCTGTKRGSRKAAEIALDVTAWKSGWTAWIEPMQPRRSPSFVFSVTKAPAGRHSSSSKSAAFHSGARPACTTSIVSRAIRRSCLRWMSLSTVDEHEVADVDEDAGTLPDDEHRVFFVNCVGERDGAAEERHVPEDDRDVRLAAALRRDPLHDEAPAEDGLPGQADGQPEVLGGHS